MRDKNEKINSLGLSSLIISLSGSSFWGILTSFMLSKSKTSTIISMPIGFIIGLIISKILLSFYSKFPNLSHTNKFKKVYKKLSIILNFIILIISIFLYIFLAYRLSNFLSSQYLTETPTLYFYVIILLLTSYTASLGIETVTRVSLITLYTSLIMFIFDLINLIPYIKLDNYLPIISVDFKSILISSIIYALYSTIPLFFITASKKDNLVDKEKFNKYFIGMYTLSFILVFTAIMVTLGIFGSNLVNMFDYPLYTVLKKIQIFSFIDSIENISASLWIFFTITGCSIINLSIFNNIKETLNLTNNNKLYKIIIFIIILLIPKFLFANNSYTETFNYVKIPVILTIVLLVIITITTIILKFKKE